MSCSLEKLRIKSTFGFLPVKKHMKKLDLTKYKKKMRCLLKKGDNTCEKRDTTSSDLLKKTIYSYLLIWKSGKEEDEEVLFAREKNREKRKVEKKLKIWCTPWCCVWVIHNQRKKLKRFEKEREKTMKRFEEDREEAKEVWERERSLKEMIFCVGYESENKMCEIVLFLIYFFILKILRRWHVVIFSYCRKKNLNANDSERLKYWKSYPLLVHNYI